VFLFVPETQERFSAIATGNGGGKSPFRCCFGGSDGVKCFASLDLRVVIDIVLASARLQVSTRKSKKRVRPQTEKDKSSKQV
jgi:hypothetical protein